MSDLYAFGGQPRSVPDPEGEAYDEMIRRRKMLGDREFTSAESDTALPDVGHPGIAESMIPVWGSGREALADLHDGHYVGAAGNGAIAASDVFLLKALAGGLLKGGLRLSGNFAWRSARWEQDGMRKWLGNQGFLKPGQHGHHWLFEQKSRVPDWLKNQPPFINGMADAVEHGRIHGPYTVNGTRLPRFNAVERAWRGPPDWFKALNISVPGHAAVATGAALNDPD